MSDMERGRLLSQHGASSQVIADYDRRVFDRDNAEASRRAIEAASGATPGSLDLSTGGTFDTGAGGEALGKLLAVLLLLAALYGVYLFADQAARILAVVWREALAGVGTGKHFVLTVCLLLAILAVGLVLQCVGRVRGLPPLPRVSVMLVAVPVGQVVLWCIGGVLLAMPLAGPLALLLRDLITTQLPAMTTERGNVAADVATTAIASLAVSLAILIWQIIDRAGVEVTCIFLRLRNWLAKRGAAFPIAVVAATAVLFGLWAMPVPPLTMPFGLWVHGPIIVGALFGWRVSLIATALAITLGQPGFDAASAMFRDGSAMRRIAIWWSGLVATAVAAGILRPQLPSTLAAEVRGAFGATCLGLFAGCLLMLVMEVLEIGSSNLMRLIANYWFDFLPRYALDYAACIGIGAGMAFVSRNLCHRWLAAGVVRAR